MGEARNSFFLLGIIEKFGGAMMFVRGVRGVIMGIQGFTLGA